MVPPDVRNLIVLALAWWCHQELHFLRMEQLLERQRQELEEEWEMQRQEREEEWEQEQNSSDEEEDLQELLRTCRQLVLVLLGYAAQCASDQTSEEGSDSDSGSEDMEGSAGQEAPPPPRAVKRRRAAPPATRSASAGSVGSNLAAGSA